MFLAGGRKNVLRIFNVPAGKSLLFPVIVYENDYPCVDDPSFQPPPGTPLADWLTQGARDVIDLVTELEVEIDGKPLENLFNYRATSPMFMFTGDPSLTAVFDSCITGTPQPAVSDGYWIMLRPLSVGPHLLHFRGKIVFPDRSEFQRQATDVITVEPSAK